MILNLQNIPCFGIAGNFTGHLEQAGEADDFKKVIVKDSAAPKGIFPTYIPLKKSEQNCIVPPYLTCFPFTDGTLVFPEGERNIQMESECGILFEFYMKDGKVVSVKPVCFGASNDCTIRKAGAKKISIKKNWGKNSKGASSFFVPLDSFSKEGNISEYKIASWLIRNGDFIEYGENSAVDTYSYFYEKLEQWIADSFNNQQDEDPLENIGSYLNEYIKNNGLPENEAVKVFISVGSTRYTEFGQNNYLCAGDSAAIAVYPQHKYGAQDIISIIKAKINEDKTVPKDVSVLIQGISIGK